MPRLAALLEELKARKVRKTIAIYASTGLTLLGVTNLFTGVYQLPRTLFDCILVILICGFPSACILAWFHGAEGKQKVRPKELAFHSLSLIVGLFIIVRIVFATGPRLIPAGSQSIAVLPFQNLSDSKEDEYFSDGITEDIITQLSKIGQLQVISRTSVMKYKNSSKTMREIGHELNVASLLEGSVRRAGNRVRIVGQLIDARSDQHLWADTYDREMKDIFAIQSEVAQHIAAALKTTLSPSELKQIERTSTENLDAYAYYLRGREYYYRYTRDDNERAIELFKKALALDQKYALAYAGLGDAYDRRQWYGFPEIWRDSAIAVSNIAISLDPNAAEGYKALGNAYLSKLELRRALDLYHKAVALNPNYASVFPNMGFANLKLGRLDEAIKWTHKAVLLQPGFARWSSQLGWFYFFLGYDSLASVWAQKAADLQPESFFPHYILGYIHMFGGRFDQARESITRALTLGPNEYYSLDAAGDLEIFTGNYEKARGFLETITKQIGTTNDAGVKLAFVLQKLGDQKRSQKILDTMHTVFGAKIDQLSEGYEGVYYIAVAYSLRKDQEHSVRWIQRAFDLGCWDYRRLHIDPLFENMHGNERFRDIVVNIDTKVEEMRRRVEQEGLNK